MGKTKDKDDKKKNNMNFKHFFLGIAFLVAGLIFFFNLKKGKPSWLLLQHYISNWIIAIALIIFGIAFIIESFSS